MWVLLLTMSIAVWRHCTRLLMAISSTITRHATKLKSYQTQFLNMTVHWTQTASTVTGYQTNRAPLGCRGTGDSDHGCSSCVVLSTWIIKKYIYIALIKVQHWHMTTTFRDVGELRSGGSGHREASTLQDGCLFIWQLRVCDGHSQSRSFHIHLTKENKINKIMTHYFPHFKTWKR